MEQTDRGSYKSYRTQETLAQQFWHSCLGKLTVLAAIIGVALFIAYLTVPDEQTMMEEMTDNIRQCIEANDSIKTDWIDDAVNNVSYIFTHADSIPDGAIDETFDKYNKVVYKRHTFYASAMLLNNFRPEGVCAGIGVFNIVIPTVNFNDFLMRVGPMHKGYDQKILQRTVIKGSESFGSDPELGL